MAFAVLAGVAKHEIEKRTNWYGFDTAIGITIQATTLGITTATYGSEYARSKGWEKTADRLSRLGRMLGKARPWIVSGLFGTIAESAMYHDASIAESSISIEPRHTGPDQRTTYIPQYGDLYDTSNVSDGAAQAPVENTESIQELSKQHEHYIPIVKKSLGDLTIADTDVSAPDNSSTGNPETISMPDIRGTTEAVQIPSTEPELIEEAVVHDTSGVQAAHDSRQCFDSSIVAPNGSRSTGSYTDPELCGDPMYIPSEISDHLHLRQDDNMHNILKHSMSSIDTHSGIDTDRIDRLLQQGHDRWTRGDWDTYLHERGISESERIIRRKEYEFFHIANGTAGFDRSPKHVLDISHSVGAIDSTVHVSHEYRLWSGQAPYIEEGTIDQATGAEIEGSLYDGTLEYDGKLVKTPENFIHKVDTYLAGEKRNAVFNELTIREQFQRIWYLRGEHVISQSSLVELYGSEAGMSLQEQHKLWLVGNGILPVDEEVIALAKKYGLLVLT